MIEDDAASIAKALYGVRNGNGWLCRCPVPGHGAGRGDRNPSLSIRDGDQQLLVKCFAGCDSIDVLDELRRRSHIVHKPSKHRHDGGQRQAPQIIEIPTGPDPLALSRWHAATSGAGSIAERYLQARGLVLPVPPSLRALASVDYLYGRAFPAMVAAVQAPDRRIVAVQLTHLDPRGDRKALVTIQRKTIGALGQGAVRLAKAENELGLAEGVEDALAAIQLVGVPTWACIGAGRMHRVAVPTSVKVLHIFADDDEPGRTAAEKTAQHHREQGRRVVVRLPPKGTKDWGALAANYDAKAVA